MLELEDPLRSLGALDMGGASAQITFVPENPPPALNHVPFQVGNTVYDLYSFRYGNSPLSDFLHQK